MALSTQFVVEKCEREILITSVFVKHKIDENVFIPYLHVI